MIARADAAAIWRLLAGRRGRVLVGMLALGLQAVFLLPITALVHDIFATQIPRADSTGVLIGGAGILGLYIASAVLSLIARRLILVALMDSVAEVRRAVLTRLHELPIAWHERQDVSALHSTLVQDGERLEACLPSMIPLLQALVVGVPLAVVAVIVSPLLTVVVLLVAPAMVLFNGKLKRRTEAAITIWIVDHRAFSAHIMRTLRTMGLIRTRGVDASELTIGKARVDALSATALGKFWASNVSLVVQSTVAAVAGGLILVVGGVAVARGDLSLGELLAFYAVTALILRNVSGAAGSTGQLYVATAALRPMLAIIDDRSPVVYTGTTQAAFDGSIAFRDVTFGYGDDAVLRGVDFTINPGERVALVGVNGSGKSTIARLLLGLDRPWSGTVEAGDHPLESLDIGHLRRRIGVVMQDASIRPGTIRENITFGRPDVDPMAFDRAVAASGVADLLARFPDGLETVVGDDGVLLSGGQRQSVSIARALLGEPRLLVLDEPTNHLDAGAIARLLTAVDAMTPTPAVLVITHDPELAAWTDRALHLADGRITAAATLTDPA